MKAAYSYSRVAPEDAPEEAPEHPARPALTCPCLSVQGFLLKWTCLQTCGCCKSCFCSCCACVDANAMQVTGTVGGAPEETMPRPPLESYQAMRLLQGEAPVPDAVCRQPTNYACGCSACPGLATCAALLEIPLRQTSCYNVASGLLRNEWRGSKVSPSVERRSERVPCMSVGHIFEAK